MYLLKRYYQIPEYFFQLIFYGAYSIHFLAYCMLVYLLYYNICVPINSCLSDPVWFLIIIHIRSQLGFDDGLLYVIVGLFIYIYMFFMVHIFDRSSIWLFDISQISISRLYNLIKYLFFAQMLTVQTLPVGVVNRSW